MFGIGGNITGVSGQSQSQRQRQRQRHSQRANASSRSSQALSVTAAMSSPTRVSFSDPLKRVLRDALDAHISGSKSVFCLYKEVKDAIESSMFAKDFKEVVLELRVPSALSLSKGLFTSSDIQFLYECFSDQNHLDILSLRSRCEKPASSFALPQYLLARATKLVDTPDLKCVITALFDLLACFLQGKGPMYDDFSKPLRRVSRGESAEAANELGIPESDFSPGCSVSGLQALLRKPTLEYQELVDFVFSSGTPVNFVELNGRMSFSRAIEFRDFDAGKDFTAYMHSAQYPNVPNALKPMHNSYITITVHENPRNTGFFVLNPYEVKAEILNSLTAVTISSVSLPDISAFVKPVVLGGSTMIVESKNGGLSTLENDEFDLMGSVYNKLRALESELTALENSMDNIFSHARYGNCTGDYALEDDFSKERMAFFDHIRDAFLASPYDIVVFKYQLDILLDHISKNGSDFPSSLSQLDADVVPLFTAIHDSLGNICSSVFSDPNFVKLLEESDRKLFAGKRTNAYNTQFFHSQKKDLRFTRLVNEFYATALSIYDKIYDLAFNPVELETLMYRLYVYQQSRVQGHMFKARGKTELLRGAEDRAVLDKALASLNSCSSI